MIFYLCFFFLFLLLFFYVSTGKKSYIIVIILAMFSTRPPISNSSRPLTKHPRVSQKCCFILLTYLLHSSSRQAFKVEAIVLYRRKLFFFQFFDPIPPVLILRDKEFLDWSFYLRLVVEASQTQELSLGSEQVIIERNYIQTTCWVWNHCNFLEFLKFNLEISVPLHIKWTLVTLQGTNKSLQR